MDQFQAWPPPNNWTQVVIPWSTMLAHANHSPHEIIEWVECQPGGQYHLHGYRSVEGFAFRFENPQDAVFFKLRWEI